MEQQLPISAHTFLNGIATTYLSLHFPKWNGNYLYEPALSKIEQQLHYLIWTATTYMSLHFPKWNSNYLYQLTPS